MIAAVQFAPSEYLAHYLPIRQYRVATRRARILPSFLVIGAQRAGTTSLFDYLLRHPDVCGPLAGGGEVMWSRKELHFFDERFWRGIDWYRSFFPTRPRRAIHRAFGGDLVSGEATPYYMFHPGVPERVGATVPDMRLIALLREPVDRAYSHYQMMVRSKREELSFEEALAAEDERLAGEEAKLLADLHYKSPNHRHRAYFRRGLYAEQLERWLEHFPREQLLVLSAEDFFERSEEVYENVLGFLGLRRRKLADLKARGTTADPKKPWGARGSRNRARYEPLDPATRADLERRYREPNARLAELLGRDFGWNRSDADQLERARRADAPLR